MGCLQSKLDDRAYKYEVKKIEQLPADPNPELAYSLHTKKFSDRHSPENDVPFFPKGHDTDTESPTETPESTPESRFGSDGQPAPGVAFGSAAGGASLGLASCSSPGSNPYGSMGPGTPFGHNPYGSVGSAALSSHPPSGVASLPLHEGSSPLSRTMPAGGASTNPYGSVGSGSVGALMCSPSTTAGANPYGSIGSGSTLVRGPSPGHMPASEYQFSNLSDASVCKLPGSILGQGFTISDCTNCDIYLLDHCGQVQIDDCKNCSIYVGPTEGSVFIRDCEDCRFVVSCRQFRTRSVKRSDIMLHCRTKPIIESSQTLGFCCFNCPYKGYMRHLKACGMSIFQNFWSCIHDFTPSPCSWHFVEETCCGLSVFTHPPPPGVAELFDIDPNASGILVTAGERQQAQQMNATLLDFSLLFVLMTKSALRKAGGDGSDVDALHHLVEMTGISTVLRTNKVALTKAQAEELCRTTIGWGGMVDSLCVQECYGFEVMAGDLTAVERRAKRNGFLTSANVATAEAFRFLGITG